jgi:hypothetical protein
MAVLKSANQYKYSGKGPVDSKALVKTYAELLDPATWTLDDKIVAYNGMITAVWLNKDDTSKNGIYFLHDATCTSVLKTPDVTKETNWHKLGGIDNLPDLADQIAALKNDLDDIQSDIEDLQDAATVVEETKAAFPAEGLPGKIYVATQEATTYVWYNGQYIPVGDGGNTDEIQIISGGGPTA